jgi:type II secretory pathway component PulM
MMKRFQNLEQREKVMLLVGLIFLLCVVAIFGIYLPYRDALEQAERSIVVKQQQLDQVRALQQDYRRLENRIARAENGLIGSNDRSALALLESIAARIDSRDKLNYIRPQPPQSQGVYRIENLDIKFERLSLEQAVNLLWRVETAKTRMQVKNLRLRQRFDDTSLLDVTMTVAVFRREA